MSSLESNPEKINSFKTHGVSTEAAKEYLKTVEGLLYRQRLIDADKLASPFDIRTRAITHLTSGSELPRMEIITEPLVKIVPHGSTPSGHSPFWTKEAELDTASKAGKNLGQYFGLPGVSQSDKCDVYRVTPKAPTEVFVNAVA